MNRELHNIHRLAGVLHENLAKCADDPTVGPVHHTRTGTRRLQTVLENLIREAPADPSGHALRSSSAKLLRHLRKIRRAAAPVRDLDVHCRLLESVTAQSPEPLVPPATQPSPALRDQAGRLDAALRHSRRQAADVLQPRIGTMIAKLDKRVAQLDHVLQAGNLSPLQPPVAMALDSFARLATDMQSLHAENLHDFRKGVKKARYLAELAGKGDPHAARVARSLRTLQDQIGEWHDWLVLVEEARSALGAAAVDLIEELEAQRDDHFIRAMNSAARLRARLMREWLSMQKKPVLAAPASRQAHPHRTGTRE